MSFSQSQKTSSKLNGEFLWFQSFLEALKQLAPSTESWTILKKRLENSADTDEKFEQISDFINGYSPESAVNWYTKDFLYGVVNLALSTKDIGSLLDLYVFIIDMEKNLRDMHNTQFTNVAREPFQVYRGQFMSKQEIQHIRPSTFISINTFVSTSKDKKVALSFIGPREDEDIQPILFDIKIDPSVYKTKPFADISNLSHYPDEKEVLFAIGSIFHVSRIQPPSSECYYWSVFMELCSDDKKELKEVFEFYRENYIGDDVDHSTLVHFLRRMGSYKDARICFERLLATMPSDQTLPGYVISIKGCLALDSADYNGAIKYYQEAMCAYQNDDNLNIGPLEFWIGEAYLKNGEPQQALEHLFKALWSFSTVDWEKAKETGQTREVIGTTYRVIGQAYYASHDYKASCEYLEKAMEIYETYQLPQYHAYFADLYVQFGNVYRAKKEFDLAILYHQKALQKCEDCHKSMHIEVARAHRELGLDYEAINNYKQALEELDKAMVSAKYSISEKHPDHLQIEQDIERVKQQLSVKHGQYNYHDVL